MRWLVVIAVLAACGAPTAPPTPPISVALIFASPGPLIASHDALACVDCHVDDSPKLSTAKCVACHSGLKARADDHRGLHGSKVARGKECASCHRDHRGATFDALGWDKVGGKANFDHRLSGRWPLGIGHRIACDRCHTAVTATGRPTFVGVDRSCESCHATPHAGTPYAKLACDGCHASDTFKTTPLWDHDERTTPIGAAHRSLACATCHTPLLGTKAPATACQSCHAAKNPHGLRFDAFGKPPACGRCHAPSVAFTAATPSTTVQWRPNTFDHGKDAKWDLGPFHDQLACAACHSTPTTPPAFVKLGSGKNCTGCHEHQQVHALKYSNKQCLQCHVSPGWWGGQPSPARGLGVDTT